MTYSIAAALLDCDYIIALFIEAEVTHSRAKAMRDAIIKIPQFILRPTTYELATVLSRKFGHATALSILKDIQHVQVLNINELEKSIWLEFRSHTKKSTSFFDCANLVAAKHYGMKIASFDSFYPKAMLAG